HPGGGRAAALGAEGQGPALVLPPVRTRRPRPPRHHLRRVRRLARRGLTDRLYLRRPAPRRVGGRGLLFAPGLAGPASYLPIRLPQPLPQVRQHDPQQALAVAHPAPHCHSPSAWKLASAFPVACGDGPDPTCPATTPRL